MLRGACRFAFFLFSPTGEVHHDVQSESFLTLSQTEIKNRNMFSSINTQRHRTVPWNLFKLIFSNIYERQTTPLLWHWPSASQASIILDADSSGGQQVAGISSTLGRNQQSNKKWNQTAPWILFSPQIFRNQSETRSGTTKEESLPRTCVSVYSFTVTVSCLFWLDKMIIEDCLDKFPIKQCSHFLYPACWTPHECVRLHFWWLLAPFCRTMWGKQ